MELEEDASAKAQVVEELEAELNALDKEIEDKKSIHEQVVNALKDVRASTSSTCLFSSREI